MHEIGRKNNVSPEGRAAMSAAGTRNMAAFNRSEMHRVIAVANEDAVARAEALIQKTIAEIGGEERLTARQATLVEAQRTALIVLCTAQVRLKRKGVLTRGNRPDPLLATINNFANLVRLNLEALGVPHDDPNAPPRGGITDYLAQKERAQAAAETTETDDGTS